MRKVLFATAALAAATVAQPAFAAINLGPTPIVFNAGGVGVFTGTHNQSDGFGNFTDTWTFTLPFAFTLTSGSATAQNNGGQQDLDITSICIGAICFAPDANNTDASEQFALASQVFAGGNYTLTVLGKVDSGPSANYTGNLNIVAAPVPEPATWAMFLFGFTAVGYSLRRRRTYRLAQAV